MTNIDDIQRKVDVLKTQALKEFEELCKYPHPTFHVSKIFNYLISRIKSLGFEPQHDLCNPDENYGNVWFDIPATPGCENWKKLLFQGHMDMVYAGPKDGFDKPITPVYDEILDKKTNTKQKVIHSKDYLTSLGADDGIGVATMLAIAQDKNIKHGPIRFVITCDEESGSGGAQFIKPHVFDADYLINVDGELDCGLAIACYGTCNYTFRKEFSVTNNNLLPNCFRMDAHGFHGGHSGEDVGFRFANAERMCWQVLNDLLSNAQFQIVKVDHCNEQGIDQQYQGNAIIPNAGITFYTNLTQQQINDGIIKTIESVKDKYRGENWNNIKIAANQADKSSYALTTDDSKKLIIFLGSETEGLICGLVNCLDETKHVPGASGNVGPTNLDATKQSNGLVVFDTKSADRSYLANDILVCDGAEKPTEKANIKKSFVQIWENIFGYSSKQSLCRATAIRAWEDHAVNPLRDLLVKGYKDIANKEPKLVSLYGVLEQAYFLSKKPDMLMITIGPRIESCHTNKETLYLETLDAEYKSIIYTIENFDKI